MKNILTSLARHSYKKHTFLKEWRAFILLTLIVKLAAMLFSIFAGFFYFDALFYALLNSSFWAKFFAVINLLLIEILTAIAISKFFKFAIRGKLKTAIPIILIVAGLFSVSFISSTNGLALRQSKKVDATEDLQALYMIKTDEIDRTYQLQRTEIKTLIDNEKQNPQGWTGGKRTTLTPDQLHRIDSYYKDLKTLSADRKTALLEVKQEHEGLKSFNDNQVQAEADKFYNIVTGIMGLIFLVNGLLMFFYSKIFEEREEEAAKVEVLTDISEEMQSRTDSMIEDAINSRLSLYFEAFTSKRNTAPQIKTTGSEPPRIGFMPKNDKTIEQNDKRRSPSGQRLCKQCGKPFEFKHWNKTFCDDECRVAHWEKLNPGKKIYRKNYKK